MHGADYGSGRIRQNSADIIDIVDIIDIADIVDIADIRQYI